MGLFFTQGHTKDTNGVRQSLVRSAVLYFWGFLRAGFNGGLRRTVVQAAIEHWQGGAFGGADGFLIARKTNLPHGVVLRVVEKLAQQQRGSMNANVSLLQVSLERGRRLTYETVRTHVYFPAHSDLESGLATSPVAVDSDFLRRLHRGVPQLSLVYFREEVLVRYFDHPELHEVKDSQSGGAIEQNPDAPPDSCLAGYLRFGRRTTTAGKSRITVLLKDLAELPMPEQQHWLAHESTENEFVDGPDFNAYLEHTFTGTFKQYEDAVADLARALRDINSSIGRDLFRNTANPYLRLPVENTRKAFVDMSSELFKLVGPDSLSKSVLVEFVVQHCGRTRSELQAEGSLVLLREFCEHVGCNLYQIVRRIKNYRIDADHKIIDTSDDSELTSQAFIELVKSLSAGVDDFRCKIEKLNA